VRTAWRRLREAAFDDGLLRESYDPQTGWPRTRARFAWPARLPRCCWATACSRAGCY